MSRAPVLLLLAALALAAKPASFLLKDVRSYDPLELPKSRAIDREMDRIKDKAKEEAKRKHPSDWGARLVDYVQKGVKELKLRLLAERSQRHVHALATLADLDDAGTTKAVCDVFVALEQRLVAVTEQRKEMEEEHLKLLRVSNPDPYARNITLRKEERPAVMRLRTDIAVLADFGRRLAGYQVDCARILRSRSADESRLYLRQQALVRAKHPRLRAKLADILSADGEADPEVFLSALSRERDPGVRAMLVTALGRLRAKSVARLDRIAALLQDRSPDVRMAVARTLARLHVPEAVGPLVARMPKEEGQALTVFARSLESLTGEKHGIFPDVWAKWWEQHRTRVLNEGLPPPGGGEERARRWDLDRGYFFGIPQESNRIVYILDTSGSMKHKVGKGTRLQACVKEFKQAVGKLPQEATFNVIAYSQAVRFWKKGKPMLLATKANRASAGKFADKFNPEGSTNIYDALKTAFEIAGAGPSKKGQRLRADTFFLLTDGAPTTPDGKKASTEKILEAARLWNADRRITIHTIGIGDNLNVGFLRQLAEEHNGEFIHRRGG